MSTIESPSQTSRSCSSILPRTVGFPKSPTKEVRFPPTSNPIQVASPSASPGNTCARPAPAKRAKGRLFIGLVLASIFLGMGTLAWNEFGRFSAYGIMEGRIVHVTSPFAGILETMHVRDGEYVTKGQLLASIDSSELRIQIDKLQGELEIAKAAIDSRRADLKLRQRENGLDLMRSQLDYYQLVAQFHAEKAKLLELNSNQEVFAQLSDSGAVSRLEAAQNRTARVEQHSKVETLQQAIRQLDRSFASMADRDGASATQPNDSHPLDTTVLDRMLQVELVKVQALQSELQNLQEFQKQGEIRAPISGRILIHAHHATEHVAADSVLFRILERGSMEAHFYLTQSQAGSYRIDDCVRLQVLPHQTTQSFRIVRFDDETSLAPTGLSRFYRRDEKLVKVVAVPIREPIRDTQGARGTWLGAEVRMPRFTSWSSQPHGPIE